MYKRKLDAGINTYLYPTQYALIYNLNKGLSRV